MRRLLIAFIIGCSLILFLGKGGYGDRFGRNGMLLIFVKSDKPVYEFGEPIVITLKLINGTSQPLFVNIRFDPFNDLQWKLFHEPFGFVPIKTVAPEPPTEGDFIRLKSNEEIQKVYANLSEIALNPLPLKAGSYGLRLTYINREAPGDLPKGLETWTGEIVTNRISFLIKSKKKL